MLASIVLVVFLSVVRPSVAVECPKIVTERNFNTTRVSRQNLSDKRTLDSRYQYLGLWYEIQRNNIVFEIASKCENATYTANANGTLGVWNQAVTAYSGYYSIHGLGRVKDPSDPAALEIIFADPGNVLR